MPGPRPRRSLRSARFGKGFSYPRLLVRGMENKNSHKKEPSAGNALSFRCCGKLMVSLGQVPAEDFVNTEVYRWFCEVCGHGIDLVHFDFDEQTLREELKACGDSLCSISCSSTERRWTDYGTRTSEAKHCSAGGSVA